MCITLQCELKNIAKLVSLCSEYGIKIQIHTNEIIFFFG